MKRLLHGVISILMWTCFLMLAAFGFYFSFANYPAFGVAITISIFLLLGYVERRRRQRQNAAQRARNQRRAQSHGAWLEGSAQEIDGIHRDHRGERTSTAVKKA